MRRLLALVLLAGALAWAQTSYTPVVQTRLFSGVKSPVTAGPGTTSGHIPNQSQIGHQVFLKFAGVNPGDCASGAAWTGGLQFSFDNVNWSDLGLGGSAVPVQSQMLTGNGSYPYVRFTATWSDASCVASAWYTGSVTQYQVQAASGGQNQAPSAVQITLATATSVNPFTAPPGTRAGQIPNVGQYGHSAFVAFSCASPSWTGGFQFSYDNTTWFNFGNWATTSPSQTATLSASGSYPYVRLSVAWAAGVPPCTMSAWYTGTVYQAPVTGVQGAAPIDSQFDMTGAASQNLNPVTAGAIALFAPGAVSAPVVICAQTQSVSVNAGAQAIFGAVDSGVRHYVCSLSLVSDTAGATATLFEGGLGDCSTNRAVLGTWAGLAAGVPVVIGNGLGAVFRNQGYPANLCLSATGGKITGHITWGSSSSVVGAMIY